MTAGELSDEQRLAAELMGLLDRFPGGYQAALPVRLGMSIGEADRLFTERGLPMREQLIAELTLWRGHAEDGVRLMKHSYDVIRTVLDSVKRADGSAPR